MSDYRNYLSKKDKGPTNAYALWKNFVLDYCPIVEDLKKNPYGPNPHLGSTFDSFREEELERGYNEQEVNEVIAQLRAEVTSLKKSHNRLYNCIKDIRVSDKGLQGLDIVTELLGDEWEY